MAPLEGIEPPAQEPESCILSIKLQGRVFEMTTFLLYKGLDFISTTKVRVYI